MRASVFNLATQGRQRLKPQRRDRRRPTGTGILCRGVNRSGGGDPLDARWQIVDRSAAKREAVTPNPHEHMFGTA